MPLHEYFGSRRTWVIVAYLVSGVPGVLTPAPPKEAAYVSPSGTTLRVLLDQAALGGTEVEVAEITFPPGSDSGDHVHGATEIFYVLSGELEHVVGGKTTTLGPGMIGHVRPPDTVRHRVPGRVPAKALVIWAPGGEAARITARWRRQE